MPLNRCDSLREAFYLETSIGYHAENSPLFIFLSMRLHGRDRIDQK